MNEIQVGDKVRFLANSYIDGYRYESSDPSKHFKHLTAEDLRDQLGTVIPIPTGVTTGEDEVMVKLDKGGKLFLRKQDLTKVPKPLDG